MRRTTSDKWQTVQLGTLCDVCRGSSPRPIADQRFFDGGTIPWIKIADATKSGKFLYTTKEHVNEFGASFSRLLPKGSLIIAASGTLGYPQFLGIEGCAHDGWLIPSNYRGLDKHFLYYLFLWKKEYFYSSAYGAAIQNINTMILREMEVCIPDLPTQRKIAGVLSAYDDLIENNTRRIAILEEMAQAIYREWFVHFRFPGHEQVRLVDSPLGKIPEGWQVSPFGDVAEITMGTSPKGDTYNEDGIGMPLVNGPVEFAERFTKRVKWTTDPNKMSKAKDLIVCVRGSTTGKYVKSDGEYCLGRGVCSIRSNHQCYVDLLFQSELPRLLAQTGGSTFPSWTAPQIKRHPVLSPPTVLLDQFEAKVMPITEAVFVYSRKNIILRQTRDLLLPKLISGQLDVEELDIDPGQPLDAVAP